MRLLLDENLSHRICTPLKACGHDAVHVGEIGLAGADDEAILAAARDEGRVIVTCDHDFVQLLFASGDDQPSVILTRGIDTMSSTEIGALLGANLTGEIEALLLAGAIASVSPDWIRVRPLPLR